MFDAPSLDYFDILGRVFGFDSFRANQQEIVEAILAGRDVLAIMPTGGGKSLCYQFPAVVLAGVCVVVSPLLALMKDQVDSAREMGIRAESLNSTSTRADFARISDALRDEQLDLLYISPERFNTDGFVDWLSQGRIAFFAIDEAHCISQWGHHFRVDYQALSGIVQSFPTVPVAAFTATATEFVSRDIETLLGLRDPYRVRASFDRPNLYYQILYKDNPTEQLTGFLDELSDQSGIVYCGTRKKVEQTVELLTRKGYNAQAYHAGLTDQQREQVQGAFARDEIRIMVATVAFGMGIDKSNVRFVAHLDLPKNIEQYYQETGRAGRDGSPARCLLLYGYQDICLQRSFIDQIPDDPQKQAAWNQLNEMVRFAQGDQCRRKGLLAYFSQTYECDNCGNCDYCTGEIVREDATIEAQKALSAIVRTGNRFGAAHIIDVLTGANTDKIRRFGHDQLPTWGVGKDRKKSYWRQLVNALILKGAAVVDPESEYPIPQITPYGWAILRSQETFQLIRVPDQQDKKRAFARSGWTGASSTGFSGEASNPAALVDKRSALAQSAPEDRDLFERLRALRRALAQERNVPPYVIFADKTLLEMARLRPTTPDQFLAVSGIGKFKLDAYGDLFMDAIRQSDQ